MTSVVLVAGSFHPREGGAERQMRMVLSRFAEGGHQVSVLTQAIEGRPLSEEIDGIRVTRIGPIALYRRLPRIAHLWFAVAAAVRLTAIAPRTAVSLQFGAASAATAMAGRLRPGIRRVVRLTGGGTTVHRSEPYARASSARGRMLVRLACAGRPTLVAPAHHLLDDFRTVFPAIDLDLQRAPNGVREVTVGDVDVARDVVWYSRRGSERSVEAFLRVAESLPQLTFTVMGAELDTVPPNVTQVGWVSEPEQCIAGHRILLNTSPREGMPNTALQALSVGTRVAGYANAGLEELRSLYPDAVRTVDLDDVEGLASAVQDAVALPRVAEQPVPTEEDVVRFWRELVRLE